MYIWIIFQNENISAGLRAIACSFSLREPALNPARRVKRDALKIRRHHSSLQQLMLQRLLENVVDV